MTLLGRQVRRISLSRCAGVIGYAVLCLLTCGCGLVHVPYATTFPRERLCRISVRAYDTRQPLPNANVSIFLHEQHNWFEPAGCWSVADSPDGFRRVLDIDRRGRCETWPADRIGEGEFEATPRTKCSWVQVWFPLPAVLGPCLYHTYDAVIVASAPGHKTVWLTSNVILPCKPNRESGYRGEPIADGAYAESADSILCIYLPRATPDAVREDTHTE
ncbi:MAG: hypothetical protein PVJ57_08790 [Phycisphaerae bacterium]|jgi:hypothetical protein